MLLLLPLVMSTLSFAVTLFATRSFPGELGSPPGSDPAGSSAPGTRPEGYHPANSSLGQQILYLKV